MSAPLCFFDSRDSVLICVATRNIVTHHAEDGSGMGAALIAGESFSFSRREKPIDLPAIPTPYRCFVRASADTSRIGG